MPARWFSSPVPDIWMTLSCSELSLPEFAGCGMRKCDSAGCALKYLRCYSVVCAGDPAKKDCIVHTGTWTEQIHYEICCSKWGRIVIFGSLNIHCGNLYSGTVVVSDTIYLYIYIYTMALHDYHIHATCLRQYPSLVFIEVGKSRAQLNTFWLSQINLLIGFRELIYFSD